jgi:hypothetical protein
MISIVHTIAMRVRALLDCLKKAMHLSLPRCRLDIYGIEIIAAFVAVTGVLPRTVEALSVEVTDRDDNSWGIDYNDIEEFGLVDCTESINVVFTVTLDSESTSGRELYLYEGSSCDEGPEDCRIVGEGQSASDTTFEITVDTLFENGCDSSDTVSIWPALLESEDENEDDGGYWGSTASISLDISGPSTVPTGLSTLVGSGNVRVSWDEVDDDDVAGFLVVYWAGGSTSDTGSDAGSDTETECSVSGGFTEGDDYDPSLITGYEDSKKAETDATDATVSGLENGVQYNFAVVSLNDAANPSVFSEVVCAMPEETVGFGDIYSDAGGKGGGNYCFIATAAFGSYDHPVVRVLREFRDKFLAKMLGGRAIIAAYYAVGPMLAGIVEEHATLREAVQKGLFVFSGTASILVLVGPARVGFGFAVCLLAGLVIGFALPRHRQGR